MSPILLLVIASGFVQVVKQFAPEDQHWVRCLTDIATRHLASGRTLAISLPSSEHSPRMADVGQHLLGQIHQENHWSLIVCPDSNNTTGSRVIPDDDRTNYIVFVTFSCSSHEISPTLDKRFSSLDFKHKLMTSWNTRTRFVIAVENCCTAKSSRKISQQILSYLWMYKVINVVIVIQQAHRQNLSTSTSVRSRHMKLELYTWLPYHSPNQCTQVEDVVLLNTWVMDGNGYFEQELNLFPQKIGKQLNGCPLRVMARSFDNMVEYKQPLTNHSDSRKSVIVDGWEIKLLRIITNSLNMTEKYLLPPYSFDVGNQVVGAIEALVYGKADIVFGGVESRVQWGWEDYIDITNSYFSRRMLWYVPCSFQHPRWSSIFRIFSQKLWFCLVISLAVISITLTVFSKRGVAYSKSHVYWTVMTSFTCAWAVILGITAPVLPRTAAVRVAFLAWILFSLAVNAIFQSFLTTFLTESGYENPIEDTDHMLASEIKYGYHPLFDHVYLESGDVQAQKILSNRVLCPEYAICLKWAKIHKNISLILDELSTEEQYASSRLMDENSKPLLCRLADGVIMHGNNVMLMHTGDPLLESINDIIQRVVESGIFMQWKKSHFDKMKLRAGAIRICSPLGNYYSFAMKHMQPAFYLLLMGFTVSTFIFVLEMAHHSASRMSFVQRKTRIVSKRQIEMSDLR